MRPSQRLNAGSQFNTVFKIGKRFYLKSGLYIIAPNDLLGARLGLLVAKKKLRQAVKRNYLKRLQRELFRSYQNQLQGYDVVFVAGAQVAKLWKQPLKNACINDWYTLIQQQTAQLDTA